MYRKIGIHQGGSTLDIFFQKTPNTNQASPQKTGLSNFFCKAIMLMRFCFLASLTLRIFASSPPTPTNDAYLPLGQGLLELCPFPNRRGATLRPRDLAYLDEEHREGLNIIINLAASLLVSSVSYLAEKGSRWYYMDGAGNDLLLQACLNNQTAEAKEMVVKGANPFVRNKSGYTPFIFAAHNGDMELLKFLHDTCLEIDLEDSTVMGFTALFHATRKSHAEAIKYLLELGADPEAADKNGQSVLMQAAYSSAYECFLLILEACHNIDRCGPGQRTALMVASRIGRTPVIQKLLEHGAKVNLIDACKCNAIHLACEGGYDEAIQLLLLYGADPTMRSWDGVDALGSGRILKRRTREMLREFGKFWVLMDSNDLSNIHLLPDVFKYMLKIYARLLVDQFSPKHT